MVIFEVVIIWDKANLTFFVPNCWPLHYNAGRRFNIPVQPHGNQKDSVSPSQSEGTQQFAADVHKPRTVCTKTCEWLTFILVCKITIIKVKYKTIYSEKIKILICSDLRIRPFITFTAEVLFICLYNRQFEIPQNTPTQLSVNGGDPKHMTVALEKREKIC